MGRKAPEPRAALALDVTVRRIEDDRDAYLIPNELRVLAQDAKRFWTFHGIPTTVELPGKRYAKNITAFPDHMDEPSMVELVREYADNGAPRPASYADAFHVAFQSPRVPWSVNVGLAGGFAGGWQEALKVGLCKGVHYKYDMRSAYLWAGSLGLPDVRTYRRSSHITSEPGCYRVVLDHAVEGAPYPFSRGTRVLATTEEIDLYGLPVARVLAGVTWKRLTDPEPMLQAIRRVSTWKQAGRSYWGRWGQTQRVRCHAGPKDWDLPAFSANIPWAAIIVARVKAKLWTYAKNAVHVFVDSLITPDVVPTGDAPGDWKLEKTYAAGVLVKGPGAYGEPGQPLDKMSGVPANSPARKRLLDQWADLHPELLAG